MNSWSYSMYSAFAKCLRYGKLVYVDKLDPGVPQSGDLAFGSALHSAINAALTVGDADIVFETYWGSYKDKELEWGRFKWAELRELGLNFISKFSRLHAKKYAVEVAEVRWYSEYEGLKLEGTADFYGTYAGKLSLRDFKTAGYNYDKAKADIALQLNLYAYLAIKNGLKAPETLGYTVFNKGTGSIQDLTWDFDQEKMESMLEDMVSYINGMEAAIKEAGARKNPNSCIYGSNKCDYFNHCWRGK